MMLGVDIEEVERFQKLIRNKKFLKRIFTPQETAYCFSKKNKAQHFAVRFAAKEAVWKALSEVILRSRNGVGHREIGIRNDSGGKPIVVLPPSLRRWSKTITISLSHTRRYAVAVVVVQK